jgi:peptidoglycan/LPS O-acetylase OafA/YrhL
MVLQQRIATGALVRGTLAFLLSMVFAASMYFLVERPLAKLRSRFHREGGRATNPSGIEAPLYAAGGRNGVTG